MTKGQNGGKIKGGQIFIFAKKIKNDGKIMSSGNNAKTHLQTEKYSGTGSVESHGQKSEKEGWLKKYATQVVVGVIIIIVGGLVLYYVFGI